MNPNAPQPIAPRRRARWPDALCAAMLAAIAALYYRAFFNYGFFVEDEGWVCMMALRLLGGEVPYLDLSMGYGLLWFQPVMAVFTIAGPSLLALRILFHTLQALTALMGYGGLRMLGAGRTTSFTAGLFLVLWPGTTYKAFIPLLLVTGFFLMALAARLLNPPSGSRSRAGAPFLLAAFALGALAGAGSQLRYELGLLVMALVFAWLLLLLATSARGSAWLRTAAMSFVAAPLGALLAIAPVYLAAREQGWERWFWKKSLALPAQIISPLAEGPAPDRPVLASLLPAAQPDTGLVARMEPPRLDFHDSERPDTPLIALAYYVLAGFLAGTGVLVAAQIAGALRRRASHPPPPAVPVAAGAWMLATAGALSFLVFRPDIAHLAEATPMLLIASAALLSAQPRTGMRFALLGALLLWLVPFCLLAMRDPLAGTIARRMEARLPFRGENGVEVKLHPHRHNVFSRIHEIVTGATAAEEPLLAAPYAPGFNFMTARPSCMRSMFLDESYDAEESMAELLRQFDAGKPGAVIVSDWRINGAGAPTFTEWAWPVMQRLERDYNRVFEQSGRTIWLRQEAAPGNRFAPGRRDAVAAFDIKSGRPKPFMLPGVPGMPPRRGFGRWVELTNIGGKPLENYTLHLNGVGLLSGRSLDSGNSHSHTLDPDGDPVAMGDNTVLVEADDTGRRVRVRIAYDAGLLRLPPASAGGNRPHPEARSRKREQLPNPIGEINPVAAPRSAGRFKRPVVVPWMRW